MFWLLIALGTVAGLLILVAIIGSFLPMGHVVSRSIRFDRPVEEIWRLVTDYAGQPAWRKELTRVEPVAADASGSTWKEFPRRGTPMTLQTVEAHAPHRLVRKIADKGLPFGGRWVYELSTEASGCVLKITEEGEVYNPIFRFIGHFFINQAGTLEEFLRQLAKHLGQEPRIENPVAQ